MTSPMGQSRDVNVTVNASVDPYVKSMTAANEVTVKLVDGLEKLDKKIQSLVKRAGAGIGAAGTGGVLGMIGSAREAAQLEKSFESLAAATVRSGEDMNKLVGGAKNLSREIPVTTAALAGLMTQVRSLGVDGVNNITRMTRVAAELSAATNTAPGALFTGLAELGRSMGTSIQNIERYGSSVTTLSQDLGVSAEGVVGFANQIQAVASKAGVAETQVLGLAAAFSRVGADGFAGAQAFNTVINQITDAVATNSSLLNTYSNLLGMTRERFVSLAQADPTEVFVRFTEAIRAQGPRATQVLQQFGLDGVRMQRVIASITGGQADLRTALGKSSQAYEENTATAESAAAAWDGTADSFEKAKTAAHNLATTIGGPVADALQPIMDGTAAVITTVDDLFKTLNNLPAPFQGLGSKILGGTFGLLAIGGALTALSWSAIKFLGVWRLVSGVFGIQAFRGVADGLRGTERSLDGVSRAGQGLYAGSRALGAGIRGDREGAASGGRGAQAAGLIGRGTRTAVAFPLTRARQMGREILDTARYPFSPERRNRDATDPFSALGMYQMGERAAERAAQRLRSSGALGVGTAVLGSAQQQAARAADYVRTHGGSTAAGYVRTATDRVSGWGSTAAQTMQARLRDTHATTPEAPTGSRGAADTSRTTRAFNTSVAAAGRGLSTMASTAASAARTVSTGFMGLARGMGSFLTGPWGMLAMVATPLVIAGLGKLGDAFSRTSDKMSYTGAEMADRLNREFVTPEQRRENAAKSTGEQPWGEAEVKTARSGDFQKDYESTLAQIEATGSIQGKLDRIQLEINKGVQQNNGKPLDDMQQSEIRQLMIATFGTQTAREYAGQGYKGFELDMTGRQESNFYGSSVNAYADASGDDRTALREALATNVVTDYMDPEGGANAMAYALAQTQVKTGGNNANRPIVDPGGGINGYEMGNAATGDLIEQIVNDFNAQNEGSEIDLQMGGADDFKTFLNQLDNAGASGRALKESLEATGISFDQYGAITTESLQNLATAANGVVTAIEGSRLADAIKGTALNQSWQDLTGNKDAYITSALANPDGIEYQQNLNRIGEAAGYEGGVASLQDGTAKVGTLFDEGASERARERIRQITELKNVIGDPNDPTYKALDQLLGTAYAQMGQVSSGTDSSPATILRDYSSALADLDVANPLNADQFESQHAQLVSMVQSNLATLKGYYLQVRDMNRSLRYGEEDHNRQLGKMRRDFTLQQKESNYQRSEQERLALYAYTEQQRQAAHSYSESLRSMKNSYDEAFGNPAAFVSAQYTQGASSAMIGMERQVEYLKRSLSGLQNLRGMGVSNDVIKLLGLDDPTNFQQVEKYLTDFAANPALVQAFNSSIRERLSLQEALAGDPSNSQLVELNRQFEHSASEAERAFKHAAEESTKAFGHSWTLSQEGFDRGLSDMVESYRLGVSRTHEEMGRLAEEVMIGEKDLLAWAAESGIAGVESLGAALTDTIDDIQRKMSEMLLGKGTLNGGAFGSIEGGIGTADSHDSAVGGTFVMGADGKITLDRGKKQQTTATGASSFGASLGGQMGNSMGLGIVNGLTSSLAGVFVELGSGEGGKGGGKGGGKSASIPIKVNKNAVQSSWAESVGELSAKVDTRWSKGQARSAFNSDLEGFEPHRQVDTTWSKTQARTAFNRDLAGFAPHRQVDTTWSVGQASNAFNITFKEWNPRLRATVVFDVKQVGDAYSAAVKNNTFLFGGISTGGGGASSGGPMTLGQGMRFFGGDGENSPQGNGVVNAARGWIGTMYKWGGESEAEGGVDCSGLVIDAYRKVGMPFAGRPIASTMGRMGRSISLGDAAPGDVLYYDNPGPTDHVAIVSGKGRMIEAPTVGQRVRETSIRPPTSVRRMYATGAVFDSASDITVGEAGPETVLPLNAHGAQFVARTIQASLRMLGINESLNDLRRQRSGLAYATPQTIRTEYHHVDQSTTYGDVTVQASDPREMQRKLDAQKRTAALTRPLVVMARR